MIVFLKTREKRRETERKTELELQTVGPKIQLEQEARQSHSGRPLPPVPPHSRSYTSLQTPEPFYNTHTQYAETPKALSVSGFAHTSSSAALLPKPVGGRKDEWEIPYDELKLGKRIGEGSFGQVETFVKSQQSYLQTPGLHCRMEECPSGSEATRRSCNPETGPRFQRGSRHHEDIEVKSPFYTQT